MLRFLALALLGALAGGLLSVALVVAHFSKGLPGVERLKKGYDPPQLTRILARDGTVLADVFTERRTVIPFTEIQAHTKLAFLAAEDAAFYEHEGLDYLGMLRAMAANLRSGSKRQGGSTITQQVVKNVLLDAERTYARKIKETILARKMEQSLTKDEIFGLYLNQVYLGHGRYGIEEAARYYFGKKARALDLAESALLAGLLAAPERFSPRRAPERALERRRYVLGQMKAKGFVDAALLASTENVSLRLAPAVETESGLCPEAVDAAKRMLSQSVGAAASRGGFEITTTIDPALQAAARKAVRENLEAYATRHGLRPPYLPGRTRAWGKPFEGVPLPHRVLVGVVEGTDDRLGTIDVRVGQVLGRVFLAHESRYNPGGLSPSRFTERGTWLRVSLLAAPEPGEKAPLRLELGPESALVAIDVRTREVLALVGSYEAMPGGRDRATFAQRQPGSAFKPFVYGYALHARKITAATVLDVVESRPKKGEPPRRRVSVRDAVAKSDNEAAARVLEEAGAEGVVSWARALGIESALGATPSLALGAYEVTPIEMAGAFAAFASGGEAAPTTVVSRILRGTVSVAIPPRPPSRRPATPDEAYLVTSLLQSVVDHGTARRARSLGRPVAGKTGTTNESKDAWFVGYSTDIAAAVWVGFDDAWPLGKSESGAMTALPAWIDFMKAAHAGRPITEFVRPGSIVVARIDPLTGLLARDGVHAVEEVFLDGTAPSEMSPEPDAGAPREGPGEPTRGDGGVTEEPPPF